MDLNPRQAVGQQAPAGTALLRGIEDLNPQEENAVVDRLLDAACLSRKKPMSEGVAETCRALGQTLRKAISKQAGTAHHARAAAEGQVLQLKVKALRGSYLFRKALTQTQEADDVHPHAEHCKLVHGLAGGLPVGKITYRETCIRSLDHASAR
ncbi:MAG: hypothetical protein F9K29_04315 [Hyphomicrobiaceae bacterium]|nr:MAG: hypothetical protein F9K29_04315 [Hyphomicrobiaceae bacterium]